VPPNFFSTYGCREPQKVEKHCPTQFALLQGYKDNILAKKIETVLNSTLNWPEINIIFKVYCEKKFENSLWYYLNTSFFPGGNFIDS